MIRSALLISAGLLAALTFACVAVAPPPPPAPPPMAVPSAAGRLVTTRPCSATDPGNPADPSDPGSFAANVIMAAPNFVPANFGVPPSNSLPGQIPTRISTDLKAAFIAAPMEFRTALCSLTGVYIDPTNIYSWGYRDPNTVTKPPVMRYIGLSEQYFWGSDGTATPPAYSLFETTLLAQVMSGLQMAWPAPPWPTPFPTAPNAPTFAAAFSGMNPVDTPTMTVLAALAHELGHVLWYDLIKASNGDQYDPTQFCQDTGTQFFKNSWHSVTTPNRWVGFDTPSADLHAVGVTQLADLQNALDQNPPAFKSAARLLNLLYANENNGNKSGVWGSLFGAISPEEDFAETFKIYIMTRADTNGNQPVTSMALNIFSKPNSSPKFSPDIYYDISQNGHRHQKQELTRKITCIDNAFSSGLRFK